jgi:hypothetical protein
MIPSRAGMKGNCHHLPSSILYDVSVIKVPDQIEGTCGGVVARHTKRELNSTRWRTRAEYWRLYAAMGRALLGLAWRGNVGDCHAASRCDWRTQTSLTA